MKYKVCTFFKGNMRQKSSIVASSHQEAADIAKTMPKSWTHIVVIGKTVKRYTNKLQHIKASPKVFRTTTGKLSSILMMFDGVAEIHGYTSETDRDEVYKKLCTVLESAASAKVDPQPTDITASSVETSDSKSILTSKKISNGSAMSVIWKVLETPTTTASNSGKYSVAGTEKSTWKAGSKASRSLQKAKAFIAKIELGDASPDTFPGINSDMKKMDGTHIKVKEYGNDLWVGEGFFWHKDWLNFDIVTYARVKSVPITSDGVGFSKSMIKTIGQIVRIMPCTDHYSANNGYCYETEWLELCEEKSKKRVVDVAVKPDVSDAAWKLVYGKFKPDNKPYINVKYVIDGGS